MVGVAVPSVVLAIFSFFSGISSRGAPVNFVDDLICKSRPEDRSTTSQNTVILPKMALVYDLQDFRSESNRYHDAVSRWPSALL